MDNQFLQTNYKLLLKLFLVFFDFRQKRDNLNSSDLTQVENHTIKAFLALVVKLNENMFKPMFLKIVEWSQQTAEDSESIESEEVIVPFFFFKCLI